MRALIVDDEALARSKLLHMLQAFPDVEVIAEASDGAEALMLASTWQRRCRTTLQRWYS
jgi:two-component system LytT family response regulator